MSCDHVIMLHDHFIGSTTPSNDTTSLATNNDAPLATTTAATTTTVPALFQTLSGDGGFTKVASDEGKDRNSEGEEMWPSISEVEYLTVKTVSECNTASLGSRTLSVRIQMCKTAKCSSRVLLLCILKYY